MYQFTATFRKFLSDCRGAVTVDYVVLTAAATGVALASTDVVIGGLGALADNVTEELTGEAVPGETPGLKYIDGFENGAPGWIGAEATNIHGIGNVLGPIAGSNGVQSVTKEFQMMAGLAEAKMLFDVYAMDSIDNGEYGHLFMDGVEIGKVDAYGAFTATTDLAALGLTVEHTVTDSKVQLGGNMGNGEWWKDSKTSFAITMKEPNEFVTFGFGSSTNQEAGDESFAIDNFKINGLYDPDAQAPEGAEASG